MFQVEQKPSPVLSQRFFSLQGKGVGTAYFGYIAVANGFYMAVEMSF